MRNNNGSSGSLWSGVTNLFGSSSDFKTNFSKNFEKVQTQGINISTPEGRATISVGGAGGTLVTAYPYSVQELEQRNIAQENLNKNILTINLIFKNLSLT
jgi:hypothetical protein